MFTFLSKKKPKPDLASALEAEPAPKLHVFIDGSWLLKACYKDDLKGQCADTIEKAPFDISFDKLRHYLQGYIEATVNNTIEIGDCYIVMSVFKIPANTATLLGAYTDYLTGEKHTIEQKHLDYTVFAAKGREAFVQKAVDAGFSDEYVLRSMLQAWGVRKHNAGQLNEKQADTRLTALLVKYALTKENDYFAIISGDADMLPAIQTALEFTKNVILVTTHPDSKNRDSSPLFVNIDFPITPVYLNDIVEYILTGEHIYRCKVTSCGLFFDANRKLDERREQPRCAKCKIKR